MALVGAPAKAPQPYDFRRPNKFNREHVRALQIMAETFARQFTTVLSTTLRAVSHVSVSQVSQLTYDEYIRTIPNPSHLAILSIEPLQGRAILNTPLPVMMSAIDRLLGGQGSGEMPDRPLSEIEQSLARSLLDRVLRELAYAFEPLTPIRPVVLQQESNPQFAQVASAADMVILISFDMRIGDQRGVATLCTPFASLQPVLDAMTADAREANRTAVDPRAVRRALEYRMDDAPLTISVSFREVTLSSGEIIALRPGDVLPLLHPVDEPLEVTVGGRSCFKARPGRKGKRLACLIVADDEGERNR
jgi:flagellar motor switch protein FliM